MKIVKQIFEYPSKHFISSFLALMGFSMSVMMDKNQTDDGFINSIFVLFGVMGAMYIVRSILSPITKVDAFKADYSQISQKMLNFHMIFGIILFIALGLARGMLPDFYRHSFDFWISAVQVSCFIFALNAWNERGERADKAKEEKNKKE